MKTMKITFWVTASLLAITQGIMPLFTVNSEASKQVMQHLGYPPYFALMLNLFKFLGGLAILLPFVPRRIKEWAFAGFAIDFICAAVSFIAVDGFTGVVAVPLVALLILMVCYVAYDKLARFTLQNLTIQ
ncbi:MAG: DoxX family protein [Bacteroidetes bacterium]|nr:DoxX family protein [Bacteroidota bacterium]